MPNTDAIQNARLDHIETFLANNFAGYTPWQPPSQAPLITAGSWNVNAWGPRWQLDRLRGGQPVSLTIPLQVPNYNVTIDDFFDLRELLEIARDRKLPIVFRAMQNLMLPFSGDGIDYSYFRNLPRSQSASCWWQYDADGNPCAPFRSSCTSPAGNPVPWEDLGYYWGGHNPKDGLDYVSLAAQVNDVYPDPPAVGLLDNNEAPMLPSSNTPDQHGYYRDRDAQWTDFLVREQIPQEMTDDEAEIEFRKLWADRWNPFLSAFEDASGYDDVKLLQYGGWDTWPMAGSKHYVSSTPENVAYCGWSGVTNRNDGGNCNCYYKHDGTGELFYGHLITQRCWWATQYIPHIEATDNGRWCREIAVDADRQRMIESLAGTGSHNGVPGGYHDPERVAGCAAFLAFMLGANTLRYYRNSNDTLDGYYITPVEAAQYNVPHYTYYDYSEALLDVADRMNDLDRQLLTAPLLVGDVRYPEPHSHLSFPERMHPVDDPQPDNPLFTTERSWDHYDPNNGDHRLHGWFEWPDYVCVRGMSDGRYLVAAFSPLVATPESRMICLDDQVHYIETSRACEFTVTQ